VLYRARLVTYADDFVILSCGHAAEALAWTRWAFGAIGLALNEAKTSLRDARREAFTFLGYSFGPAWYRQDGHWYLAAQPAKKSLQRVKRAIRALLCPGNQMDVHRSGTRSWGRELVLFVSRLLDLATGPA
jgi:RNA-directed DNA polymerase